MLEVPISTLVIDDGERQLCQACLRLVMFGPELGGSEGLAAPFNAFMRRFALDIGWYRDGFHQSSAKRFTPAKRDEVVARIRAEVVTSKGTVAELFGVSRNKDEWVAPSFSYFKSGKISAPFFMMSLPLSWLDEAGADGVLELINEVIDQGFPLASGYAGLSIMWNHSKLSDKAHLAARYRQWITRYPGLMHPNPLCQIECAASGGLVDIGWFTLLGAELAAMAGGSADILDRVPEGLRASIEIEHLAGGALVVRAGALPRLGGSCIEEGLASQRAVGAALSLLCDPDRNARQVVPGFGFDDIDEARRQWANRFFI